MSHHSRRRLTVGASAVLLLTAVPAVVPAVAAQATSSPSSASTSCTLPTPFRGQNFSDGLEIDNRFLPMIPGTRHVYNGTTGAGSHQIVSTVTDLTKVVDGVTARVVQEVDIQGGQVTESELTLFAQDDAGDVWNLAEYPELFNDKGRFIGAPDTWVAGLRNAQAGIHMVADPTEPDVRNRLYLQGSSPSIAFLDCARVHAVGHTTTVPAGTFHEVLTTWETSPLQGTAAIQTKEHAPHVGIVRVGAINDPEGETLVLTRNVRLDLPARRAADQAALREDAHGRATEPLWARTPPAQVG